jgi:hypothetical protein
VRCGGNLSGGDPAAELSPPQSGGADPIAVVAEEEPAVADLRGRGVPATDLPARTSSRRRRICVH